MSKIEKVSQLRAVRADFYRWFVARCRAAMRGTAEWDEAAYFKFWLDQLDFDIASCK